MTLGPERAYLQALRLILHGLSDKRLLWTTCDPELAPSLLFRIENQVKGELKFKVNNLNRNWKMSKYRVRLSEYKSALFGTNRLFLV